MCQRRQELKGDNAASAHQAASNLVRFQPSAAQTFLNTPFWRIIGHRSTHWIEPVTETEAGTSTAPALSALGGWSDADWFCPTVLSDEDVVGFTFPDVAGLRRQSFHVLDRTKLARPASHDAKAPSKTPPSRLPGKMANVFEQFGAKRAVACCRSKLFFETGAVLFFGEFPLGKLKQRSANKLRRNLIEIGVLGCILRVETASAIGMFWPATERRITGFVDAAAPDHALHGDFEKAALSGGPANVGSSARPARRSQTAANARETELLEEIVQLRKHVEALRRVQSPLAAMEQLGLDDARLKAMLKLLHPDKHGNSAEATDAAKWLNNLRDVLRGKTA